MMPHGLLRRKTTRLLLASFLLFGFVTGCTPDMAEVDDINIVLALGVDQIDDQTVEVSAQIVRPHGQAAEQEKSAKSQCIVKSVRGSSIEDAIQRFELVLPRKTFLPHNTMFVFGKSYAEKGIDRAFDYLERDRNYRRNQLLLLTQGSAKTLISADTPPESVNAMGIRQLVKQYSERSKQLDSIQLRVMRQYLSASQSPVLTSVGESSQGTVQVAGTGIVHNGRVTTWLNSDQTMGLVWFLGRTHNIVIHVPSANGYGADRGTTFRILSTRVHVKPVVQSGSLLFAVHLKGQADILRACKTTDMTTQTVTKMEKQLEQDVEQQMKVTMGVLKQNKVDGIKFGTRLYQVHPQVWRKLSKNWDTEFQKAAVTYDVQFHILRSGLSSSSPDKEFSPNQLPPKAGRKGNKT